MKCPECGEELNSGVCLKCGHIQTYENIEDAFSHYTGYASGPSPEEPAELPPLTPPVPETAPLNTQEPLEPEQAPWLALSRQSPMEPLAEESFDPPLSVPEPPATPPVPGSAPLNGQEPLEPEVQSIDASSTPYVNSKPASQPAPFVRICPKCGRPMPKRFCGGCGYDSGPLDTRPGIRICPVCGTQSKGVYCGRCGRDLRDQTVSARPDSFQAASPAAPMKRAHGGLSSPAAPERISPKKKKNALILCLLFGVFGAHRMYVGKWGTALLCMMTCGFYGIWPLADLIFIALNRFRDKEGRIVCL